MPTFETLSRRHIDGMCEIEQSSFKTPWSRSQLEGELRNYMARYVVLVEGDKVLGYAGYMKVIEEAHILNIAVHPDYRGKGYGKLLLNKMMSMAGEEGLIRATLEVNEFNEVAIRLYEGYGFKKAGRRIKYYEGTDDALIYWTDIGE